MQQHLISKISFDEGEADFDDWHNTGYDRQGRKYMFFCYGVMFKVPASKVEKTFSGFNNLYARISAVGCTGDDATTFIKYCLERPYEAHVDEVVKKPGVLTYLMNAMAIGVPMADVIHTVDGELFDTAAAAPPTDIAP